MKYHTENCSERKKKTLLNKEKYYQEKYYTHTVFIK